MHISCSDSELSHENAMLYCFMRSSQLPTSKQLLHILKSNVNLRLARPLKIWTAEGIALIPTGMIRVDIRMTTICSTGYVVTIQDNYNDKF